MWVSTASVQTNVLRWDTTKCSPRAFIKIMEILVDYVSNVVFAAGWSEFLYIFIKIMDILMTTSATRFRSWLSHFFF
jgi:hypothetical protein